MSEINKDNPDKSTGGKKIRGVHADLPIVDEFAYVNVSADDALPIFKKMDKGQLQWKWRTQKGLEPEPGELVEAVIEALDMGGIKAWNGDGVSCVTQIIENILDERDEYRHKYEKAMWTLKYFDKHDTQKYARDAIKDTIEFLENKKL
jgi:hypothetical protein